MTFQNRKCTNLATFAGSLLICGATALAQTGTSGSMQQPSSPGTGSPNQQTQSGMGNMGQDPNMTGSANGQTTPMDKMFVQKALQGGMAEVQLGQLALQKSSNDDVKQFAQKMIDDHGKMGDQLKPIAQKIGVKTPDGPSKKDKATMAKMQALSGDAFDKAYINDMVKDHKTDLNDFKTEASNGTNPDVKNVATQGSQVISQHLDMIQQIAQKNGAVASK